MELFHYTDDDGFKGISSARVWRFRAEKPPGPHDKGAYFTDYNEHTVDLAIKLRIPKSKIQYFFCFSGRERVEENGLERIEGGRGDHVFFSRSDYEVPPERQIRRGSRE